MLQMRNRKRNTDRAKWTENDLQNAIEANVEGKSLREAARLFNIPVTTLHDRIKTGNSNSPSLGRNPVFSKHQEEEIAKHVISMAKAFYGISPAGLRKIAFEYAEKNNIIHTFSKEKREAGEDWLKGFLKRNPSVSIRKPEPTSIHRIAGFNKEEVDIYFSNLSHVMDKYQFHASKIFNFDESGITGVQKPGSVLAPKGQKQIGFATSGERGRTITICCAMNAIGSYVPPMMIFPGCRLQAACRQGGPEGTVYACSKSGWITEELFILWLQHFVSFVKPTPSEPALLILDNHSSHISLQAYNYCKENGVVMLSLPPHTSHRLQPLDITFFGPLKGSFNKACDVHMREYPKILTSDVPQLFKRAYLKVANMDKAVSGFRAAGIYPLNPEIVGEGLLNCPGELRTVEENPSTEQEQEAAPSMDCRSPSASCEQENRTNDNHVSIAEISPIPGPSGISSRPMTSRRGRKKQHSEHLTSTPMKQILEEKAKKRQIKEMKTINQTVAQKKSKTVRQLSYKSRRVSSSEDEGAEGEEEISYEDSDDDLDILDIVDHDGVLTANEELCCVCGEFGRDREVWYKCSNVKCGNWTHKDCSSWEKKGVAYQCDFCV